MEVGGLGESRGAAGRVLDGVLRGYSTGYYEGYSMACLKGMYCEGYCEYQGVPAVQGQFVAVLTGVLTGYSRGY